MKITTHIRTTGALLIFCVFFCGSASLADFKKTKIAVLDFELHGQEMTTEGMGGIVAEWFTTTMVQAGRFDVIERAMLQKILDEQKLAMVGIVDENSASKLGKLLGVQNVISGSLLKLPGSIEVNARIIDVESGSIVAAESVTGSTLQELQQLVTELTQRIVFHFPISGYVVKKKDNLVTIDLGQAAGLHTGMKFVVFKEGEVIKHPKTGEVLDVEQIHTGLIRITKIRNNVAEGTILAEQGEGIIYGQMVESIPRDVNTDLLFSAPPKIQQGSLTIRTIPEDARVRILNIDPKYTPGIKLKPGQYQVEVSKPSYKTVTQWIELLPAKPTLVSIQLDAVIQPGSLTIRTTPEDAAIRILNIDSEYTPGIKLKPGRYQVEVSKPSYKTLTQWVELPPAKATLVSVKLETVIQPGSLTIRTTPEDARIRILNIDPKYTPGIQLTPGRYQVEVSKPSYKTLTQWVELPPAKETLVSMQLEAVIQPGSLTIRTTPEDAVIKILNISPKYTPGIKLKPGRYQVKVSKPSYKTVTQWIEIPPAEPTLVSINLEFIPPPPPKPEPTPQITKQPQPKKDVKESLVPGKRDPLRSSGLAPSVLPLQTGSYKMGGNRFMEKPKHNVTIDRAVFMMTTEVTFADYEKFCKDTGHPVPDDFSWGKKDRPVINVSWSDANNYAKWLTKQTGIRYRLPFETEWEWAAKAKENTQYPWGNSFKKNLANCKTCGSEWDNEQTAPVRSFAPNKFGFYDMAGNVWEWTQDCWAADYTDAPNDQSERKHSDKCSNYTVRGGAWNSHHRQVTTSSRMGIWGNTKSNYIGFRLVKDPHAKP